MDSPIFIRPEVRLHACPKDGDSMFRVYDDRDVVFECVACGYRLQGEYRVAA